MERTCSPVSNRDWARWAPILGLPPPTFTHSKQTRGVFCFGQRLQHDTGADHGGRHAAGTDGHCPLPRHSHALAEKKRGSKQYRGSTCSDCSSRVMVRHPGFCRWPAPHAAWQQPAPAVAFSAAALPHGGAHPPLTPGPPAPSWPPRAPQRCRAGAGRCHETKQPLGCRRCCRRRLRRHSSF